MYRIRASSNKELVDNLMRLGLLHGRRAAEAMRRIDRANFCPNNPYIDMPIGIDCGQTISAPHMHAHCLDLLEGHLRPGSRVLDVGVGSGIMSALFGTIVGDKGRVIGIDIYPDLVERAMANIRRDNAALLDSGVVSIQVGDGWKGAPDEAPFDVIHVGAAAESMPQALVDQLKPGGRLIIPVGEAYWSQHLQVVDKNMDGSTSSRNVCQVSYVPLQKTSEKTETTEKAKTSRGDRKLR